MSKEIKRIYWPIWMKIKTEGKAFVKCKNAAQARVIKAVIKEKYMDPDKIHMNSQLNVVRHKHGVEFTIIGKLTAEDF